MITSASANFDAVLPSLGLIYAFDPSLSAFAKYTRGFKPGGFIADRSTTLIDTFRFSSETSDNYEIGFKNTAMNGRAVLNGSLFYSDFRNSPRRSRDNIRYVTETLRGLALW